MPVATMTSKGQVTVPHEVREAMRLEPGVRVNFTPNGDGSYSFRPAASPISDLFGCLPPYQGSALSIEEMNDTMADGAAEANR